MLFVSDTAVRIMHHKKYIFKIYLFYSEAIILKLLNQEIIITSLIYRKLHNYFSQMGPILSIFAFNISYIHQNIFVCTKLPNISLNILVTF